MDHLQIAIDHHAGVGQLPQHAREQFAVAGHLIVQPDIAHRQREALQQMKDRFQLDIRERFARDPSIEERHTHHHLAIENRNGDLRAEDLKFLLDFIIGEGQWFVAAKDAA